MAEKITRKFLHVHEISVRYPNFLFFYKIFYNNVASLMLKNCSWETIKLLEVKFSLEQLNDCLFVKRQLTNCKLTCEPKERSFSQHRNRP